MNPFRTAISLFLLLLSPSLFSNPLPKLIPYRQGAKWGFCDSTKKIIVPCRFTSVEILRDGYAAVHSGNKFGYIDSTGKIYHEAEFEYDHHESTGVFEGNFMCVKKNGKCGMIDKKGKWVIQPLYNYLGIQEPNKIFASLGQKAGYLDTTGKIIFPFIYDHINEETDGFYVVRKKEKYGLINEKNKLIIPIIYDQVGYAEEGVFFVSNDSVPGNPYPRFSGFIDSSGKEIRPVVFRHHGKFSSGRAAVSFGGKWGYIDHTGKLVIDTLYDHAGAFSCNRACVTLNGKYGYIDPSGKLITEIKYATWNVRLNRGQAFKNNLAIVELNGKSGLIDTTGKEIFPCRDYTGIWWQEEEGCYAMSTGGYGINNRKFYYPDGKMINAIDSRDPVLFREGPRIIRISGDYVFFYQTITGDTLNNTIYHKKNNPTFFTYMGFHEGRGMIFENGKAGFIDASGKTVIACKYDQVTSFRNGLAFVHLVTKDAYGNRQEKSKGYIDYYGTEYWED